MRVEVLVQLQIAGRVRIAGIDLACTVRHLDGANGNGPVSRTVTLTGTSCIDERGLRKILKKLSVVLKAPQSFSALSALRLTGCRSRSHVGRRHAMLRCTDPLSRIDAARMLTNLYHGKTPLVSRIANGSGLLAENVFYKVSRGDRPCVCMPRR